MPPIDLDDRALFIERVLPASVTMDAWQRGEYQPLASIARQRMQNRVRVADDTIIVDLDIPTGSMTKRLTFRTDGSIRAEFTWDVNNFPVGSWFTTEISTSRPIHLVVNEATVWEHPIETVAKSERGLDRTLQGTAYMVRWPVSMGSATVDLDQ
jgi:hypothetical protein